MALQTSIVEYFNLRKRGADSVDLKKDASHKVLILDKNSVTGGDSVASGRAGKIKTGDVDTSPVPRVIVYAESPSSSVKKTAGSALRRRKTPLTGRRSSKDKQSNKFPDIRKCLFGGNVNSETKYETPNQASQEPERVNVPFRIHSLSPSKQLKTPAREPRTPVKEEPTVGEPKTPVKEEHSVGEPKTPVKEEHSVGQPSLSAAPVTPPTISCPEPPTTAVPVTPPKKETHPSNEPGPSGINDEELIRAPKKARKFAELKHRLHKFNEGVSRLKDLQERNQKLPPLSPKIKEFKTIELEVDSSPTKKIDVVPEAKSTRSPSLLKRSLFMSPKKGSQGSSFMSPRKLFDTPPPKSPSKPAYQEYYDLAIAGKPALPLPYKYKVLAETFRSVDTVVSMMFNRNEAATFTKVKASAQQLSKRNLTEEHIGQILTVMPTAYELRREKIRVLGGQRDQYELVLKPVIPEGSYDVKDIEERGKMSMTPSMTLERRRNFYTALIEKVKDQHEVFLRGLNPPLVIPREELMRWHPDFNVDGSCPDITPAALPSAPVQEKLSTARDVLNKAKDMLSCNNRMGKALERLSGAPAPSPPSDTAIATAALTKALKGIPKALLEKVRAKQAAKTAALLTRCPEETKRRLELTRLPELTRILRNIYVLERKNVIPLPVVLQKLSQSFRENLSQDDLKRHISMIMEAVPGWIAEIADGDKKYLRLSRDADFSRVTNKLQTLIDTNRVGF